MTEQRLTGGTCVNFGCTQSKAFIRCSRAVHDASRGSEFGFRLGGSPRTDFAAVMERVRRMRSMSSAGDAVQAVEQAGVEVYLGHTRFIAPNVVEVDGGQLRFRKAVTATGSDPLLPPIDGLRPGEYFTNESVFSLTELPARLVVIGGGPLACELAQAFRLGYWFFLFHLVPDLPEALITGRQAVWLRHFFSDWCFDPAAISGEAFDTYVRAYQAPGAVRGAMADYRANAEDVAQDTVDAHMKIACAVMSLWGAEFYAVGKMFDMSKVWAEMASDLVTHAIPQAGHLPQEEQPDVVNRLLMDFLEGWQG